jgi:uncharacterized protein YndB with AHSA1/START domain/DNA-binding transcriptional ArsR family regulator
LPIVERVDTVFKALADPHRRELLDRLNRRNGQTLQELCVDLDMSRQAVSKHLGILEAANLVATVRRGREKLHYLNAAPIREIADRWIRPFDRGRVEALADLKTALEDPMTEHADRPEFVYVSYLRTTPERLWAALTEPAFTRRYWDMTFESAWTPGASMAWCHNGVAVTDPEQVVLDADPPRRLSYTWHTFTPEWAASYDVDEAVRERVAAERRSRVTFTLEPDGEVVKLTVVHDGFEPGSEILEMVRGGWPKVIGALKTLLEAGGDDGDGFTVEAVADAPMDVVFSALTTLDGLAGWWMPDVTGSPREGGEVTFRFDGEHVTMAVEHVEVPSLVVWRCTACTKFPEWEGTSVWFDLRRRDASSTIIHFRHVGLQPSCDCYGICSGGWDHYIGRSLPDYVAGAGGHPRGSVEWEAAQSARL